MEAPHSQAWMMAWSRSCVRLRRAWPLLIPRSRPQARPLRIPHGPELAPLNPLAPVALHRARDPGDFRRVQRVLEAVIEPMGLTQDRSGEILPGSRPSACNARTRRSCDPPPSWRLLDVATQRE